MLKILLLIAVMFNSLFALTVDEILDKMEQNQTPKSSKSIMKQIVYQPSGRKNESKLISYSADSGDKSLMEYIEPKRIKGMKILQLNDGNDIWFYSKRTDRVRKIASNQKKKSVNGSDFSYEDMSTKDTRDDYNAKLIGEEKIDNIDCYKIEFIPKKDDVSYSKIVAWIDKSRFVSPRMDFYDESGNLWKRLTMENIKKVGKYFVADKIVMKNLIKGSKTEMIIVTQEFDIDIDKSLFTQRGLKR